MSVLKRFWAFLVRPWQAPPTTLPPGWEFVQEYLDKSDTRAQQRTQRLIQSFEDRVQRLEDAAPKVEATLQTVQARADQAGDEALTVAADVQQQVQAQFARYHATMQSAARDLLEAHDMRPEAREGRPFADYINEVVAYMLHVDRAFMRFATLGAQGADDGAATE